MRASGQLLILIAVGLAAVSLHTQSLSAQDPAEIARLAAAFETARITGDEAALRGFVAQGATSFNERGNALAPLAQEMEGLAANLRQAGRARWEPLRVVQRDVALRDGAAVVSELLGASLDVESGTAVEPRRRTLVWERRENAWKLAHVHTSPYTTWEQRIEAYEEQDRHQRPQPAGIVFVGSSSIVGWNTLAQDFPAHNVIGRGFGGSQMIDSVLYAHRIVTPYEPRAVVVYAGDNDIAQGKSAEQVYEDFKLFVDTIHAPLPATRIAYIPIKPSIQRWPLWPKMKQANALIQRFAEDNELVDYLDTASPMLGANGEPKPALFLDDGLHLNADGYALWTTVVKPWLESLD